MLGRHVAVRDLPLRGRGVVAERALPAGALVLVSPALAVSVTGTRACAFCCAELGSAGGLPCSGDCGLAWCSAACRSAHAHGFDAATSPLLLTAPHDAALCKALGACGSDCDARLAVELLARRCARRAGEGMGWPAAAPAEHARSVFQAAAIVYAAEQRGDPSTDVQQSIHDLWQLARTPDEDTAFSHGIFLITSTRTCA